MAAIHDLLAQVQDEVLRARLEQEINRLSKTKKFGLVFEEHLPECTPLYDIPVKRGSTVAKKTGAISEMYEVSSIKDGMATCYHKVTEEKGEIPVDELICVAQFGEPIYPYLKPIDSVCNAPDSDLWHTLIEADNYHALQLLEYLYAGKVDCIYIDPPYNTGAKDWKYNNNYVDSVDAYRHSKWLSFMKRRLNIAKKLLNPKDSVLIITIDEKEYLHLGCLLEELFPEARMQMVSSVINPAGAGRQTEFARTDEYIYFVQFGDSFILPESREEENVPVIWDTLRRSSLANARGKHGKGACGPNQFYPIYVNDSSGRIEAIGDPVFEGIDRFTAPKREGCTAVFPVRPDGTEMNWGIKPEEAKERLTLGYLRAGKYSPNAPQQYVISYVTGGNIKDIEAGVAIIDGYEEDGSVRAYYPQGRDKMPTTNWNRPTHDAQRFGTNIISPIIGGRFQYPKSVYAVFDCLKFFIANKKNALVVDFFAGSGTTLHAINLMNAEDDGKRRCIMVTNNEVSEAESKALLAAGHNPGDNEWESLGIARYVTWPRTVCSIEGHDINGKALKGNYLIGDKPMSEGFSTNVAFFKLGFLDKVSVALGHQLKKMLPVLWLKAGAYGPCPQLKDEQACMMVLTENKFAILVNEKQFREFDEELQKYPEIQTIYIVTDSEAGYHEMIAGYAGKDTFQLYRDYLDNFRINTER